MGRIGNTFKHGDSRTKGVLALMILGLILGIAALITSFIVENSVLTFISVILLIADIGYILSTRFSNVDDRVREAERSRKAAEKAREKARRAEAREKAREKNASDDTPGALDWISSDKKKSSKNDSSPEASAPNSNDPALKNNHLLSIDEAGMKKLLFKYKVKKEHVAILIDNCREKNIYECPAILWKDKTFAYLLLLEEEPRMLKFSLYDYRELHINASVPCYPSREYAALQPPSFVGAIYKPLLPNYRTAEGSGRSAFKKSLYGIGPDIFCTSGSVQNIMKVLSLELVLTESKINKENYGKYFREVYCARLLYRDSVYNGADYKEKVLSILTNMAHNADSDNEFAENLTQMLTNGLIPQEYAEFATQRRKKR